MDLEASFSQIYNQSDADKSASGMASGSQDPSFTPGSMIEVTELPSQTGDQDTAVSRVLPFSQVAPGFDTPIPIGVSTAPFGTGAAEAAAIAGVSTGAVTGAAGAQVQETAAQAQARHRLEGLWASSKSSSLPFRARIQGSRTALPYSNLILWVVSLL